MKVGLLFGSFNPVHRGHLAIAKAGLRDARCAQVWFVIQEKNSYKKQPSLAKLEDRIAMVRLATKSQPKFRVAATRTNSIVKALENLKKHFNTAELVLLMGQDLVTTLPQWTDYRKLIKRYHIYGYQRQQAKAGEVSSHRVRLLAKNDSSLAGLLPPSVANYIKQHQLYR